MEDHNIVQLLDKVKKNLERGAIPIAISEIEATMTMLERKMALAKGKRFAALFIPQDLPGTIRSPQELESQETRNKVNEIVRFLNERFPV